MERKYNFNLGEKKNAKSSYFMIYLFVLCMLVYISLLFASFVNDKTIYMAFVLIAEIIGAFILKEIIYKIIYIRQLHKENKKDIVYIRDIDAPYSPAVLAFLINKKINPKRDLVAAILNLVAQDFLKISKIDGKFEISAIEKDISGLNKDDQYLYKWMGNKLRKPSLLEWKKLVISECERRGFVIDAVSILIIIGFISYMLYIIGSFSYMAITNQKYVSDADANVAVSLFFGMAILFCLTFLTGIAQRKLYTRLGVKESCKWTKFKNFINDFTLIKDASFESVIILERYLAYSMALNINKSYNDVLISNLSKAFDINIYDELSNYLFDPID